VENVKEEIRQLVGPYAGTRGALQARRMPARDPPEEGERFPKKKVLGLDQSGKINWASHVKRNFR
jgi:hypothetical protein